jgi:hypothetical protein
MLSVMIVLNSVDLDLLLRYTTDGKYAHLRTTPLLRAMYGFDPETGERFTWEDYRRESREAGEGEGTGETEGGAAEVGEARGAGIVGLQAKL